MAGRINNPAASQAFWPWPGNVREKIIERNQLVARKKVKKGGDPKNPPLASAALLEFMGPGHTSEELRFPAPVNPRQGDARTSEQSGLPTIEGLVERGGEAQNQALGKELQRLGVPQDRLDRLRGLLQREQGMLQVMGRLSGDLAEIHRRMSEEQRSEGY